MIPLAVFAGRESELKKIYKNFQKGGHLQTILGQAGVGKSELVLEYAHRHHKRYETIWWINARSPEDVLEGISDFVMRKNILKDDNEKATVFSFMSWMENNANWLLIYDDVDHFPMIETFLPKKINGHILLTSRLTQGVIGEKIPLDVCDEETAIDMLQAYAEKDDRDNAKPLAERLGRLTLALKQAGVDIAETADMDFVKYLALLDSQGLKRFAYDNQYTNTIAVTFQLSWEKLRYKSSSILLILCAYFSPSGIDIDNFIKSTQYLPEPLKSDMLDETMREQVLKEITRYSLAKVEYGIIYVNRLFQEVIRTVVGDGTGWIVCCLNIIKDMFEIENMVIPNFGIADSNYLGWIRGHRKSFVQYMSHAASVAEHAKEKLDPSMEYYQFAAFVYFRLALLCMYFFLPFNGLEYIKTCIEMTKKTSGGLYEYLPLIEKTQGLIQKICDARPSNNK